MPSVPIFTVDAFTAKPFAGNPAAVCVLEEALPEDVMKSIAAEMNLSEKENHKFSLRWLTPTTEVPLCGHATLATSYVLMTQTELAQQSGVMLRFETLSGELTVEALPQREGEPLYLQMNFPLGNPQPVQFDSQVTAALATALGTPSEEAIRAVAFCSTTKKLLVEFNQVDQVLELSPSPSKLMEVPFPENVRGVICTSGNTTDHSQYHNQDFVSRYFAPWVGINEDPVTGSAHTVLGAYWEQKKCSATKSELVAFQASPGRGGELRLQVLEKENRILIRGTATIVLQGQLHLHV